MFTRWDFEQLLTDLTRQHQLVTSQLSQCPNGALQHTIRDKKQIFMQAFHDSGKRKRIRINKRPEVIDGLARKKYLEIESGILTSNIHALETLLDNYVDLSPDLILQSLPQRYRDLPEERFFSAYNDPLGVKKEFRAWAEMPFEQNAYRPWEKTHTTTRGIKVRSKSEVVISEKLDIHGLPSRYEEMIYFQMYDRMGIVPWKNLIVTYDTVQGETCFSAAAPVSVTGRFLNSGCFFLFYRISLL